MKAKSWLLFYLARREGRLVAGYLLGLVLGRAVCVCSEMQSPGCGTLLTARHEPMRRTVSKLVTFWSV